MKVSHPKNNSGDSTGHGQMHVFIGRELLPPKADKRYSGQGGIRKEMRDEGERRTENKIIRVIYY